MPLAKVDDTLVSVASRRAGNTFVCMSFWVEPGQAVAGSTAHSKGSGPRARIHTVANIPVISIVDDDASMREVMSDLITSLGFTAYDFASAAEFLGSPRLAETCCVISDVQMPNMNGIELQRALIAGGHDVPIIFYTAFTDVAVEARAKQAGAHGFFYKPFDSQDMIRCLEQALATSRRGVHDPRPRNV
jgi:FixJ family two-component response regulator